MVRLGAAADDGALWLAIGATLASLNPQRRRQWLLAGAVGPAGVIVNYPLKVLFKRTRPLPQEARLGVAPNELSFPSAHATSSFAAAKTIHSIHPMGGYAALSLATIVGVGRPYLGMHSPSDVAGGAACGLFIGWLAARAMRTPLIKRLTGSDA